MEYVKLAATRYITLNNEWVHFDTRGRVCEITVIQGMLNLRAATDSVTASDTLSYYSGQTVRFMGKADLRSDDGTTACRCLAFDPV